MTIDPATLVREFWARMQSNDFDAAAALMAPDFVLEWPQSGERIRGPERFARMNAQYPAHGPWRFTLHRLVAEGATVVTDVGVTDGVQRARAISFFEVREGRIARLVEFWPEPFAARPERSGLSEVMPEVQLY